MLDLLYKRRSIRKFTGQKVEKEKLDKIIEAALLSPSSRNIRPWEFIIVEEPNTISKLSKSKKHGSSFLKGAALAIIVIADHTKSDVWVEDASIASIIIQLEAEKLGLGSCWIQIRNRKNGDGNSSEEYVRKLLAIPENYSVESIIAIGYPDEDKPSYKKDELQFEKVHYERFK